MISKYQGDVTEVKLGRDAHKLFLLSSLSQLSSIYLNPQQNWLNLLLAL